MTGRRILDQSTDNSAASARAPAGRRRQLSSAGHALAHFAVIVRPPYRFVLRLLGIPIVAVVGVFIYSGIRDRLVLPECDSDRAKKSLAEVLQQFKYEPTTYAPIKTVSTTKDQVVCSAVLAAARRLERRRRLHVLLGRRQGEYEIFGGTQGNRRTRRLRRRLR